MSSNAQSTYERYRLSVNDYHRMAETGIFSVNDRLELIEGQIFRTAPIGSKHASYVARLQKLLERSVGDSAIVWVQNPVVLPNDSEPQPDICLLRLRDNFYQFAHPHPEEVLLIIEVADTTLRYDREIKLPLYARHAVPEVWIVDLENRCLCIFREPAEDDYRRVQAIKRPGVITPVTLSNVFIDLTRLF